MSKRNLINAPLNSAMATMEDIVAQFIDWCPEIYNEYIGNEDANGYYMRPEEMFKCPTYYDIMHCAEIPLSVTLYKKAIVPDEDNPYAKPIESYTRGTIYKFNGKKGQFPKLYIKKEGTSIPRYNTYNLVRLCDIEAEFEVKNVVLTLENISFVNNVGFPFKTDNIKWIDKKATNRKVIYNFELTDNTYLYFCIRSESWFQNYNQYNDYVVRIYVNGKLIISEPLDFDKTYRLYDITKDVDIKIIGTKRQLAIINAEVVDDVKGFVSVTRISSKKEITMTGSRNIEYPMIVMPGSAGSSSLDYEDYIFNADVTQRSNARFNLKFNVIWDTYEVESLKWQLRVKINSATDETSYVYMSSTGGYTINDTYTTLTSNTITINNIPSHYASYILRISGKRRYHPVTFYVVADTSNPDLYTNIRLFNNPSPIDNTLDDEALENRLRYSYTTREADYNYWQNMHQIPWSMVVDKGIAEEQAGNIIGVKVFEGKYNQNSVSYVEIAPSGAASSYVPNVISFTNGKTMYISLVANNIDITVMRTNSDLQVYSEDRNVYLFSDPNINIAYDTTVNGLQDKVRYTVYILKPMNIAGVDYTTLHYTWQALEGTDWGSPIVDDSVQLFDKDIYKLETRTIDGIDYLYYELEFENIKPPAYLLNLSLDLDIPSKDLTIKIPKLDLKYKTLTITGSSVTLDESEDKDYYIFKSLLTTQTFSLFLDLFSKTPDYFSEVTYSSIEYDDEGKPIGSEMTSANIYPLNPNPADLKNVIVSYTCVYSATKVEIVFNMTMNPTQYPITVINQQANIQIYDEKRDLLITDTIVEYDETDPLLVMTYANTNGEFLFKIERDDETIESLIYNHTVDDSGFSVNELPVSGEDYFEIEYKGVTSKGDIFHVLGSGSSNNFFIELLDYENVENLLVAESRGKYGSHGIMSKSMYDEGTEGIYKSATGSLFMKCKVDSPVTFQFAYTPAFSPATVFLKLYYCEQKVTEDDFEKVNWIDTGNELSTYQFTYTYGESLSQSSPLPSDIKNIAKSWKITVSGNNTVLELAGWCKTTDFKNIIQTEKYMEYCPIDDKEIYYCIVYTTNDMIKVDNVTLKTTYGSWYQVVKDGSNVLNYIDLINGKRYFYIKFQNIKSCWDVNETTDKEIKDPWSYKEQKFITLSCMDLTTDIIGVLDVMKDFGFSERSYDYGIKNIKWTPEFYFPNWHDVDPKGPNWVVCDFYIHSSSNAVWFYMKNNKYKGSEGLEYIYDDFSEADVKVTNSSGGDVTAQFDIEVRYFDRSLASMGSSQIKNWILTNDANIGCYVRIKWKSSRPFTGGSEGKYKVKFGSYKEIEVNASYSDYFTYSMIPVQQLHWTSNLIVFYTQTGLWEHHMMPSDFSTSRGCDDVIGKGYPIYINKVTNDCGYVIPAEIASEDKQTVIFPIKFSNTKMVLFRGPNNQSVTKNKVDFDSVYGLMLTELSTDPNTVWSWPTINIQYKLSYGTDYYQCMNLNTINGHGQTYGGSGSPFFKTEGDVVAILNFDLYVTYYHDSDGKLISDRTEVEIKEFFREKYATTYRYISYYTDKLTIFGSGQSVTECNVNSYGTPKDFKFDKNLTYAMSFALSSGKNFVVQDFKNFVTAQFTTPAITIADHYSEYGKEYKSPMFYFLRCNTDNIIFQVHLKYNRIEKHIKE